MANCISPAHARGRPLVRCRHAAVDNSSSRCWVRAAPLRRRCLRQHVSPLLAISAWRSLVCRISAVEAQKAMDANLMTQRAGRTYESSFANETDKTYRLCARARAAFALDRAMLQLPMPSFKGRRVEGKDRDLTRSQKEAKSQKRLGVATSYNNIIAARQALDTM